MRALLKMKGGFEKKVEVPDPPPIDWRMAIMDENPPWNLIDGKDVPLYDMTVTQKIFRLVKIDDPEKQYEQQARYGHNYGKLDYRHLMDDVYHRHREEYGTVEAVATYEEWDTKKVIHENDDPAAPHNLYAASQKLSKEAAEMRKGYERKVEEAREVARMAEEWRKEARNLKAAMKAGVTAETAEIEVPVDGNKMRLIKLDTDDQDL